MTKDKCKGCEEVLSELTNGYCASCIEDKQDKERFKDEKKRIIIQEFLLKEKPTFQSLGRGIHNNKLYYGTKLYQNSKSFDSVVNDDKNIYVNYKDGNEIKNDFDLNYRFPLFDDVVDHCWSNKSINEYLYNKELNNISIKDLFYKIKKLNEKFISHTDNKIHSYVALDIIKTYYVPIFESIGRTYFKAEKRSGKTKQSTIYKLVSFNPIMTSDLTGATFFRTIESTAGTLIIDDFDLLDEEKKNNIIQGIRTGYKKGLKAIRSDSNKSHKPIGFNIYSHIVINNTLGLDGITEDRCVRIDMLRSKGKITNLKINENNPIWKELRDNLHISALQNWKEVKKAYDNFKIEEFTDRDLERIEAILVLAKCVDEENYNEMVELFKHKFSQDKIKDVKDNWEFLVYEWLFKNVKEDRWVRVKDIAEELAPTLFNSEDRNYKKSKRGFNNWVGKSLSSISLFNKRSVKGLTEYRIKVKDLYKVIEVKDYNHYIENYPTNTTLPTYPTPSTYSTQDNKEVEGVEQVEEEGSKHIEEIEVREE